MLLVLLFTFKSVGMPIMLILIIQGSIWINFSIPAFTGTGLFFMSYLVVSSIQMGANIDYAIVIRASIDGDVRLKVLSGSVTDETETPAQSEEAEVNV